MLRRIVAGGVLHDYELVRTPRLREQRVERRTNTRPVAIVQDDSDDFIG